MAWCDLFGNWVNLEFIFNIMKKQFEHLTILEIEEII